MVSNWERHKYKTKKLIRKIGEKVVKYGNKKSDTLTTKFVRGAKSFKRSWEEEEILGLAKKRERQRKWDNPHGTSAYFRQ